jgi:aminotransferase in exopolysaccharide biosynthesis
MFSDIVDFIRTIYHTPEGHIPLHAPIFNGNEKNYVCDVVDSTFVSSVGEYVNRFEKAVCDYTGSPYAVATVNGTCALHLALICAGVKPGEEVVTQGLTFVATANAIRYCSADPVFLDSDRQTLGLSPEALATFLEKNAIQHDDGYCYNQKTNRRIAAVVPMHVFGHPVRLTELAKLCEKYGIPLVEDAAESIGSWFSGRHTGTFGLMGVLSFNGNKTITTGGGGMILTADKNLADTLHHLSTTAKQPHAWEFYHDAVGYNYRMPNINAALGCAQMETLPERLVDKRSLADDYRQFFTAKGFDFVAEPTDARSNYWLNAIILKNRIQRDDFLTYTNQAQIATRPAWQLMPNLPMYTSCQTDGLKQAQWLVDRLVNIPSSSRLATRNP